MTNDSAEETLKAAKSIETIADEAMQGQEEVYKLKILLPILKILLHRRICFH